MSLNLFFAVFLTLFSHQLVASLSPHPIVLIISYDGFRYDYLNTKGGNPVLNSLKAEGTHVKYVNNAFITKTYPNHHSIATGFYPEIHGVMGNELYDPKYGKKLGYSYEFWHYSDDILPIWIANEKKGDGRHSGIMMWPGNEYNYSGILPTYHTSWSRNFKWEDRVDKVIEWIMNPDKPANLVLLYFEEPDAKGHSYGPEAPEVIEELRKMDEITQYLLKRLNESALTDHVNIFFLSDHGMQSVTRKNIIDLRPYVPDDKYDRYENSPIFMIYPKKGEANFVYNALKNASDSGLGFKVYRKDEIPERWHYKSNRRTPPILAVADAPNIFHDFYRNIEWEESNRNFTATDSTSFGVHGYDNNVMNMKPYFVAVGPLIKKNHEIKPFENVDLYKLWAHMLGFPEFAATTNGSFERVADMLVPKYKPSDIGSKLDEYSFSENNEL